MERVNVHVMFRKSTIELFTGDIIAFFVEDYRNGDVVCYQHIGQHGTADIEFMKYCTEDASPAEYAELKDELENIIGYDLTIIGYDDFMSALLRGRY